jgi:hypothetical protein
MILTRILRALMLLSLILAAGASLYVLWFIFTSHTAVKSILFPWICIPIICTAVPFKRPYLLGPATLVMIAYLFAPYSFSIGLFYLPAILMMLIATLIDVGWGTHRRS